MGVNAGKLIALEGLDGCGKSSQHQRLAARLRGAGIDVLTTREPTDGPMGQRIRTLARSEETVPARTELDWFLRDRRQHVDEVIAPALAAGQWVLSDRYTLSSVAYQGARGLDWRAILEQGEADFPRPDLVLLFEVPVEVGLERVAARGGVSEPHFERREFLEEVAAIFANLDCDYIERIDARPGLDAVTLQLVQALEARFGLGLAAPASGGTR